MNNKQINRWNILLGEPECDNSEACRGLGEILNFIYNEADKARGDVEGGREKTKLTVPDWVARAKELLPPRGFDIVVRHAVEKYRKNEILTDDAVLENIKPDINILRDVLTFKSVLSPDKTDKVKELIGRVAEELSKKMEQDVSAALYSPYKNREHCLQGNLKNMDFTATIRSNLKTWNPITKRLYPEKLIFFKNEKRTVQKRLILLVDESGSMIDSVINTALLAGILSRTRFLNISAAAFDTSVVDLTEKCGDLSDLLFSVQLGGGTDIAKALTYGASLITEPKQTIVILISDLYDGFGYKKMYAVAKSILNGGSKLLVLTAMDYNTASAQYDTDAAEMLSKLGAQVAAKTPKELCEWIVRVG